MERERPQNIVYDPGMIKEWLIEYRERWRDIETQDEMLHRLDEAMVSTSAKEMTGMPHSGNPSSDKMALMLDQKDRIINRLDTLKELHNKQREIIEMTIRQIRSSDERSVISLRYLSYPLLSWNDVCKSMFDSKEDYEDRFESYLRRTTKTHGRAVKKMATILNSEK